MSEKEIHGVVKTVRAAIKKGKAEAAADNLFWEGNEGQPHLIDIEKYMGALVDELIKGRYARFTRNDVVDQVLMWLCVEFDHNDQTAPLRSRAWALQKALSKLPLDRNWATGISSEN